MNKISLIIPCYNAERTLARCLDSVAAQTYKNIEVVLIDDNSTDRTAEIAAQYKAVFPQMKIAQNIGKKGVSAARNLGVSLASGEFLQFLDADDELLPEAIAKLHRALTKHSADIAVCNFSGNPMFLTYFKNGVFDLTRRDDLVRYYQDTFLFLLPWNKLYRREIVRARFDENVHFAEDELFNVAVLKHAKKVVAIEEKLYIYHFAAAENVVIEDPDKKSCLNNIIDNTAAGGKNSIWYMGERLIPARRKIISDLACGPLAVSKEDDLIFTRVFDFLFWELSSFAYTKADRNTVVREFYSVFREPSFIKSAGTYKKNGVAMRRFCDAALYQRASRYVNLCMDVYELIARGKTELEHYTVFLMIFLSMFCQKCAPVSSEYNSLAVLAGQLEQRATPEAQFVSELFESAALERIDA